MGISDISLTAGMRQSMLSQKDAAKKMDRTEERLATGKKVNSALDNPTSYFAAMQLNQYADDLSQLHRGIDESIQTIKAADNGITGISQLLQSMKAVVDEAKNSSDPTAKAQFAKSYDELYAQLNYVASDSSYRGTNLIGDSDANPLRWKADDLPVSFNPSGSSAYQIQGQFLGSGYALYEAGATGTAWLPDERGSEISQTDGTSSGTPSGSGAGGGTGGKLDFVFVIDSTGSMGPTLSQVEANVSTFIGNLQAEGIDGRYAFAKYGDINASQGGDPAVMAPPTFFSDAASFSAALTSSANSSGGGDLPESGLEAVLTSMSDLSFRPDASKRMLLITDATVHTTDDGESADSIAGTGATLAAAGIQLDIAAPLGAPSQTQLEPLAAATGGSYHNIYDPTFYTGGFGVATTSSAVSTASLTVQAADYDHGIFNVLFNEPPPPTVKTLTADKAGLGLYHSWVYQGFQSTDGTEAAEKDVANALQIVRTQSARFGSGSDILTVRESFMTETENVAVGGAEQLTSADMNEESANLLMLKTRQDLSVTSLSVASQAAQSILKLF